MDQEAIDKKVSTIKNDFHGSLEAAMEHLSDEFSKLQVGRAHPGLVEQIPVEAYGATQPIKNMANISIPDPKQILIQPWDKSVLGNVEKAIIASDLNLNPMNDGVAIRLVLPELTEERRKDLVKVVHKLAEEAKIHIRQDRHNATNKLKNMKNEKEISEDKQDWEEREIQKKVDDYNKKIDEAAKSKEEAIMTI